ncbi:MAG: hypothetical protein JEZ09_14110 [Salinivirgaceae bacterium]|nr:hypothetical protein [Salinivirgaceae bacterium]
MKISYLILFVLSFFSVKLVAENCNLNGIVNNQNKNNKYNQKSISNEFDAILSVNDDLLSFLKRNELAETKKPTFKRIVAFFEYQSAFVESEKIDPLLSDIPPPSVD